MEKKDLKRIIVINQDSGYLIIDIVNDLVQKDLEVSLIAGRVVARNKALHKSVRVDKIVKYQRRSKFRRLLSWFMAFLQLFFLVKTKYRKDYLFIVTNPPMATFLPIFCRNRFSLMIFDIYPDVLVEMGMIGDNSLIAKIWKRANTKAFNRADNVLTLSEHMSELVKQYSSGNEVRIVPLWGDSGFFKSVPKESNEFIHKHHLGNRFVVMYSGNLGATHNVDILIDLARRIRNPEIIFLIVGEGDRKKILEKKVREYKLTNCLLLPLQPVDKISYSFASANMAIVSLNEKATGLSLPSKTFSFMSASLPLLCIAGKESELKRLVNKYDNGKYFTPDQIDEIVSFIEEMAENRSILESYGENSYNASLDFTDRNAALIADILWNSIYN